ncbi:hypothetical protein CYJ96_01785 [Moraxella osloensis]|uniref:Uncharacterized protein n=1 Tax=Faucicola osloensis TaxID=34062 RepID=A0A2I1RKN9_FAUOS|nr:hypothetical protein CYJ96_01785 [Moraxella osloensis]
MLMQILVLGLIIALVFGFWFLVLIGYCWQAVDKLASKYLVVYIKWFILSDLYLMIWMVGEA